MVTKINPAWVSTLGRSLCTFSQSSEALGPSALTTAMKAVKRGQQGTALKRDVLITPRYGGSLQDGGAAGGQGWELPSLKAQQVLRNGRWTTEGW